MRAYVIPGNVSFEQYQVKCEFSLIIMDKVLPDLSNLKDVMSDTLNVVNDYWTVLYRSYNSEQGNFSWYINPDQDLEVLPFLENYETILGGWNLNLSVIYPFDYNRCTPPMREEFQFPQYQTFESFHKILSDLEQFGNLHLQINSFGYGDIPQLTNDIITKQEPKYPRMYCHFDKSTIHTGQIKMSYNIIFADKLEDDLSNQQDVLNDTLEIALDLFSKLYLSDYEAEWNPNVVPFLERSESILAGWVLNVTFRQKFDYNRCVLPVTSFLPGITWEEVAQMWKDVDQLWSKMKKIN